MLVIQPKTVRAATEPVLRTMLAETNAARADASRMMEVLRTRSLAGRAYDQLVSYGDWRETLAERAKLVTDELRRRGLAAA